MIGGAAGERAAGGSKSDCHPERSEGSSLPASEIGWQDPSLRSR